MTSVFSSLQTLAEKLAATKEASWDKPRREDLYLEYLEIQRLFRRDLDDAWPLLEAAVEWVQAVNRAAEASREPINSHALFEGSSKVLSSLTGEPR